MRDHSAKDHGMNRMRLVSENAGETESTAERGPGMVSASAEILPINNPKKTITVGAKFFACNTHGMAS